MYSVSVQLDQTTDRYGDILGVNSTGTPAGTGELFPFGLPPQREIDTPATILYNSIATLYDSTYDTTFVDSGFTLYLPELVDSDTNGYPDFFEVSQEINTNSYNGTYHFDFPVGSGAILTTWQRAAGSRQGTCSLYMPDYLSTFNPTFEILEYTGTLSYVPGTNAVSATISLKQTRATTNTLQGSMQFLESTTDPVNTLNLLQGTFKDASQKTLSFTNHVFYRNVNWPTNYSGYVEFDDDGTQNTPHPYAFWVLSITDTNDVDHNGIPDFSDNPQNTQPTAPRPPQLSLITTSTNLLLSISGDTGHTNTIQSTPVLPGNWHDVMSFTLTNDPQILPLPVSGTSGFWRAVAH
jgi:hypothetical protein